MVKISISLILPTYKEKDNIKKLIDLSIEQFKRYKIDYEIIVIDDNSPDGTAKAVPRYSKVKLIKRKERGLATAIRRGIEEAKKDYVMVMDTDLSHHPRYFHRLFSHYKKYDMVKPSRFKNGKMKAPFIRIVASITINFLIRSFIHVNLTDFTGSFFIIKKTKLNQLFKDYIFKGYGDYMIRLIYSAKKNNFSIKEVGYTYQNRAGGITKTYFFKETFRYLLVILKIRFWKLKHLKLRILGDRIYEKHGGGILPCKKCNKPFKSYIHYGEWGYIYDTKCFLCSEKEKIK